WLAIFFAPEYAAEHREHLLAGRARATAGGADPARAGGAHPARAGGADPARAGAGLDGFDVVATVPVVIGDDVASCAELVRTYAALYVGGMGSREQNFYNQLATRMGYGAAAAQVQELYLAKRHRDAAAAVPLELVDRTSLLGPVDRVADRMRAYAESGVTTLAVALFVGDAEDGVTALRQISAAYEKSGLAE
ncbi:MAG: hypothetical protein QOI74_2551, partial [Micromonosporaceae bacterium]|nr:hypothetical protein [Micromonosporaceae bacterium]